MYGYQSNKYKKLKMGTMTEKVKHGRISFIPDN